MNDFSEAKLMFQKYNGEHFYMAKDGVYDKYKQFRVDKETESKWRKDLYVEYREKLLEEVDARKNYYLFDAVVDLNRKIMSDENLYFMMTFVNHIFAHVDSFYKILYLEAMNRACEDFSNNIRRRILTEVVVLFEFIINHPIKIIADPKYTRVPLCYLTSEILYKRASRDLDSIREILRTLPTAAE